MSTPAFHAAGTVVAAANNVANPTTLSCTAPAGRSVGDALFCITWCRSITATISTPSGWNLVSGFPKRSGTASGGSYYIFSRVADGTSADNCSPSWSGVATGTTTGDSSEAVIIAVSNCSITLDAGTIQVSDLAAQTTTSTIPAFTTSQNNSYVFGMAVKWLDSAGSSTVTNFTERVDTSSTSGSGNIAEICDLPKTGLSSAGSTGTATVTWSVTTSARVLAISIGFQSVMPTGATTTSLTDTITTSGRASRTGASTMSLADNITTSGVRKTLGATATALTDTITTSGVRKVLGSTTTALIGTITTSGFKKTAGASAMALADGISTSGFRAAFGSSATALSDAITTSGVRTSLGVTATSLLFHVDSSGHVTTPSVSGAASMGLSFGVTTAGVRSALAASSMGLTDGISTAAVRSTFASTSTSLADVITTSGHKTTFGLTQTQLDYDASSTGTRTTFGSSQVALTFHVTASANGLVSGSSAMALVFGVTNSAIRTTFGQTRTGSLGRGLPAGYQYIVTTNGLLDAHGAVAVDLDFRFTYDGWVAHSATVDMPLAFTVVTDGFVVPLTYPPPSGGKLPFGHEGDLELGGPGELASAHEGMIAR